jgi:hypothetical protein
MLDPRIMRYMTRSLVNERGGPENEPWLSNTDDMPREALLRDIFNAFKEDRTLRRCHHIMEA